MPWLNFHSINIDTNSFSQVMLIFSPWDFNALNCFTNLEWMNWSFIFFFPFFYLIFNLILSFKMHLHFILFVLSTKVLFLRQKRFCNYIAVYYGFTTKRIYCMLSFQNSKKCLFEKIRVIERRSTSYYCCIAHLSRAHG